MKSTYRYIRSRKKKVTKVLFLLTLFVSSVLFYPITSFGSNKTAELPKTFGVTYDTFLPVGKTIKLQVSLSSPSENVELLLDQSLLRNYQVERIVPPPVEFGGDYDQVLYKFSVEQPINYVVFYLEPRNTGYINGNIAYEGESHPINQVIYPN